MTAPWLKLVGPTNQMLAMDQLNRLQAFRQAVYQNGLTRRGDAQQELLDALLLAPPVRSFPELTLQPVFRRHWHSAYAALDQGQQDADWLTSYLTSLVPNDRRQRRVEVFPLDETAWPRPDAPTVEDRGYVHSATPDIDGAGIVVGHSYSILAWSAEPETSWVLPVSIERVASSSDAIAVGTDQVKRLLSQRDPRQSFDVIVADGRYGNHRFLGALREQPCGVLVRLRADRVLYGEPGPYGGRGRPRKHGKRFAFKEPETWGEPDQRIELVDERFGQLELCLWHGLHAKGDAETVFSVLLCRVHLERTKASKPLWLAWQAPAVHRDEPAEALWRYYRRRAPLEQAIRYRKHALHSRGAPGAHAGGESALDAPGDAGAVDAFSGAGSGRRCAVAVAAEAGVEDTGAGPSRLRRSFCHAWHAGCCPETARKGAGVAGRTSTKASGTPCGGQKGLEAAQEATTQGLRSRFSKNHS